VAASATPERAPRAPVAVNEVVVNAITHLARDTVQVTLGTVNGSPLPESEPGAHIDVHLPNGMTRQYSLMSPAKAPVAYLIGVKRDARGRGGSVWLHDHLRVGRVLHISTPRNNFPLTPSARHTVLFAGGIGVTPIWSMMQRLGEWGASWEMYYAVRARSEAILVGDLARYGARAQVHCDEDHGGRLLDIAGIAAGAGSDTHFYCCGPAPMITAFERATCGIDPDFLHVERFVMRMESLSAGSFQIDLSRSGRSLEVAADASILQTLLDAGIEVPHSCEQGVCGACETRVLGGEPDHRDSILTEGERRANTTMMVCCSRSLSARLLLDL